MPSDGTISTDACVCIQEVLWHYALFYRFALHVYLNGHWINAPAFQLLPFFCSAPWSVLIKSLMWFQANCLTGWERLCLVMMMPLSCWWTVAAFVTRSVSWHAWYSVNSTALLVQFFWHQYSCILTVKGLFPMKIPQVLYTDLGEGQGQIDTFDTGCRVTYAEWKNFYSLNHLMKDLKFLWHFFSTAHVVCNWGPCSIFWWFFFFKPFSEHLVLLFLTKRWERFNWEPGSPSWTQTLFSHTNSKYRIYQKKGVLQCRQQNLTLCHTSSASYPLFARNLKIYQSISSMTISLFSSTGSAYPCALAFRAVQSLVNWWEKP